MILTLDVETTIKSKGSPFNKDNFLVSCAVKVVNEKTRFTYYTDPDFVSTMRGVVEQCHIFIGFNAKFDIHWLARYGIFLPKGCKVWDCSLAEYVMTGQEQSMVSLNTCLETYNLPLKKDKIAEYWAAGISTELVPRDELEEYNVHDVDMTYELFLQQNEVCLPEQRRLTYQMGEDLIYLANAERAGFKFDVDQAETEKAALSRKLIQIWDTLSNYLPFIPEQAAFNWDSGQQLSALLYGGTITYEWSIPEEAVYQSGEKKGQPYTRNRWQSQQVSFPKRFEPIKGSELAATINEANATTRFYQTDIPTLNQLKSRRKEDKQLISLLLERSDLTKVKEMIQTMIDKQQDGYIHTKYNQNVARTGRLSSSDPNMQNAPVEVDKLLVSRYV